MFAADRWNPSPTTDTPTHQESYRITDRLRRQYLIAVVLIATLTISSQAFVQYTIMCQKTDAPIINMAGHQRMLSQKIAKASLLLASGVDGQKSDRKKIQNELLAAIEVWINSHNRIQKHIKSDSYSQPALVYFNQLEKPYQIIVRAGKKLASANSSKEQAIKLSKTILENEDYFLDNMHATVGELERSASQKIRFLEHIEMGLMLLTLLLLALVSSFIFEPAVKIIKSQFESLVQFGDEKSLTINEMEKLTRALEVKNRMLDNVLTSVDDGIIAANGMGQLIYVNDAAKTILSDNNSKIQNVFWPSDVDVFTTEPRSKVNPENLPLSRAIRGESIINESLVFKKHDTEKFVSASAWPMEFENETGAVVIFRDITEEISSRQLKRKLQREQRQLSRKIGMNEAAINVLHNVGNALNTICVSINVIRDKARSLPTRNLAAAIAILKEQEKINQLDSFFASNRGKMFIPLIEKIIVAIDESASDQVNEIADLERTLNQIQQFVSNQQNETASSKILEWTDVRELIEDAIQLAEAEKPYCDEIQFITSGLAPTLLESFEVKQIVARLIENAIESVAEFEPECPRVQVFAELVHNQLKITVRDNGVGIQHDDLIRIFQNGYSTKPGGLGFSLHNSANSAHRMGGSLQASSDGIGSGATFELELPCRSDKQSTGDRLATII